MSTVSTMNKTASLPLLLKKIDSTSVRFPTFKSRSLSCDSDDVSKRLKSPGRSLIDGFVQVKKRPKTQDDDDEYNGSNSTSPLPKKFRIKAPSEDILRCSSGTVCSMKNKKLGHTPLTFFVVCLFMTILSLSPIPGFFYRKLIDTVCSNYILLDFEDLKSELTYRVHGQHIAVVEILKSLDDYFEDGLLSRQPLVLSFHGGQGVGKTLTARIIEKHFLNQGINVYWYLLTKERLSDWIILRLVTCTVTVFIIDDVNFTEMISMNQLQELLTLFEHHPIALPSAIIVIITSNYGESIINELTIRHLNSGKVRHDLTQDSFADFNAEIQKYLNFSIIKTIPYLPLDKEAVEVCVKNRLTSLNKFENQHTDVEEVNRIMSNVKYFPKGNPQFSEFGCKKLDI